VRLVASAIRIFPHAFHKKFELDFRNSSSQNPLQAVNQLRGCTGQPFSNHRLEVSFANLMRSEGTYRARPEGDAIPAALSYLPARIAESSPQASPVAPSAKQNTRFLHSMAIHYGAALLFVGLSFLVTFVLQKHFPYPFLFFFFGGAVASGWFGGTGPGLLSVVLSTMLVEYFFVPPFNSFTISPSAKAYFVAFVACALIASWISSSKKKTERALVQARDALELRVSERTAALMKTQGELAHLSRMLSMAELTASVVHEVGQPLTGIVTNAQACLEWLSAGPPNTEKASRSVENIVRDGTRAGLVLDRMRSLFRKGPLAKEWLDINEVISELMVLVGDEARRRSTQINLVLEPDLPQIRADRIQLQQLILNLTLNAMDAVNEIAPEDRRILLTSARNPQNEILIRVEDGGTGLPPQLREKIFEPFFTTKPDGIGVGLSISRSIVEAHNGHIQAVPGNDRGTVVEFTIPLAKDRWK
jgi:signal transduction histidine kinase